MAFNWTCPYCDRPQTVTDRDYSRDNFHFYTSKPAEGHIGLGGQAVVCSNPNCRRVTVTVYIIEAERRVDGGARFPDKLNYLLIKQLMPESSAKPQPQYIPAALREDYVEACRIRDLSPKSSATLARRCLQGMIRDFCGISKGRLIDEINELKKRVEEDNAPKNVSDDSVEAIDAVRKIGNIGAHMEKDINKIIDVDPDEAQILIELIETLFDEWYVEREKRRARFARVHAIASEKDEQKQLAQSNPDLIEGPKEK